MAENPDDELLRQLQQRESASKFEYDNDPDVNNYQIPSWIANEANQPNPTQGAGAPQQSNNLGKVNVSRTPLGMENEWKNIPVENLPSKGFGYPPGFEKNNLKML